MQKSPWVWRAPPLPPTLSIVSKDPASSRDRTWHRKLWGLEASFGICCYASPGIADVIVSCHLTPPPGSDSALIDENLVKSVIRALRFDHPTIATKFAWPTLEPGTLPRPDECHFVYEVPASEDDINTWLSDVVVRTEAAQTASDISTAVGAITHDLSRIATGASTNLFELHFIPALPHSDDGTCAVVVRFGHAISDAIGSFQFLDAFNAKLALLLGCPERRQDIVAWGEEVARLTNAVPDRARVSWEPKKAQEDSIMLDRLREALSLRLKTVPGLDLPHPVGPPSTTGVVIRTLPPSVLSRLVELARAHGCTLFNVFLSSLILALLRLHPPRDTSDLNFATYPSSVDLRKNYLRPGENPQAVACTVGFHVYMAKDLGRLVRSMDGDVQEDLWTLAKEIKRQVDEQLAYMDRVGFWGDELLGILGYLAATVQAQGKRREDRIGTLLPLPCVSSLGVVDNHLSSSHLVSEHTGHRTSLSVSNPRFSSRIPYNPTVLVHPYTWQGTLYVAISFSEGYMGTVKEQEEYLARPGGDNAVSGESIMGAREGGEGAPVLKFLAEYIRILENTAGETQKANGHRSDTNC